jgi:predicted PurR-regulated permease PerM
VWLIIRVRSIVLLLILGILLAAAIEPLVNRLRRRGFSRGQAILMIYFAIIAVLALALVLIVPTLIEQGRALLANIPEQLDTWRARAASSSIPFLQTVGVDTIDRLHKLYRDPGAHLPIPATEALGLVTSAAGGMFTTISVMIVAFYWMTEKALIKRVILGFFPLVHRDRAHGLWDEIEAKIGGWTRGQLLLMLILGVVSTIAYALLGLPFWFLLGIWAGFTELIPFVGPILGGGLAVLVALTESWQRAVIVLVVAVVLQQIEGSFLVPRVMRNAVGLTPLSVILAVLIGGALIGPLGAILAIPVAAAVQVVVQDLLRVREVAVDPGSGGEQSRVPEFMPDGVHLGTRSAPLAAAPITSDEVPP